MPAEFEGSGGSERRSESELRDALRGNHDALAPSIDADAVIRRARRRRGPRQAAIGSVTALAVAAIVVVGVNAGQLFPRFVGATSDSASAPESATSGGSMGGPADLRDAGNTAQSVNRCGEPATAIPANPSGLILQVKFPGAASANGQEVQGTATLTNTSTEPVTGTATQIPAVTIFRDGLTVWHSHEVASGTAALVDLAPGASVQFDVRMRLVACGPEDEGVGGFRNSLPPLSPDTYQVSAVVSVLADGHSGAQLVSGPPTTITLR